MSRLPLILTPAQSIQRDQSMTIQMTPEAPPAADCPDVTPEGKRLLILPPVDALAGLAGSFTSTVGATGVSGTFVATPVSNIVGGGRVTTNLASKVGGSPTDVHITLASSNPTIIGVTPSSLTLIAGASGSSFGLTAGSAGTAGSSVISALATADGYAPSAVQVNISACTSVLPGGFTNGVEWLGWALFKAGTGSTFSSGTIYTAPISRNASNLTSPAIRFGGVNDTLYALFLQFVHHYTPCPNSFFHWKGVLSNARTVSANVLEWQGLYGSTSGLPVSANVDEGFTCFCDAQIGGAAYAAGTTLTVTLQVDSVSGINQTLSTNVITVA